MNAAFLLLPFLAVRFGLLAALNGGLCGVWSILPLSLIHISEPTRP